MEKFNEDSHRDRKGMIFEKSADNVKIVRHPRDGKVYVCPHPSSHFRELQIEADMLRFQMFNPCKNQTK